MGEGGGTESVFVCVCGKEGGLVVDRKVCLCVCGGGASFQNCLSKYSLQNISFGSKHILFSLDNLTVYFLLIYIIRVECTFKAF